MEQNKFFPEIHGNFGFGCMRLPMNGGQVDYEEFTKMAETFLKAGFNYFDTAHGYIGGQSEVAIRECVSKRHDRSEFLLTNKLTTPYFNSQEEIRPFFEKQLAWCGVDYFDFYLMHAQDHNNYQKFKRCKAYETAYNGHGKASDCVKCGKYERVCPQHLEIRNLLTKVAATFDR